MSRKKKRTGRIKKPTSVKRKPARKLARKNSRSKSNVIKRTTPKRNSSTRNNQTGRAAVKHRQNTKSVRAKSKNSRTRNKHHEGEIRQARINRRAWRELPGLDTVSDHSGDTNGRPLPGKTIRDQLAALESIAPRRDAIGHLYRTQEQKRARTKRATVYSLIKSTNNTYAVHETLFVSKGKSRTPQEWASWLKRKVFTGDKEGETATEFAGIYKANVLGGVDTKTSAHWDVVGSPGDYSPIRPTTRGYLGFITHDLRKPKYSAVVGKRRKTKP